MADNNDFKNPLADPNITYKGKSAAERHEELIKEREKKDLEARLAGKRGKAEEPVEDSEDSDNGDSDNPVNVINSGDYLVLEGISCVGSDGKVFEQYDELMIAKDVIRKSDGKHESFTPYKGITHFEKQKNGLFLPSFALSCNVLVALYNKRSDSNFEKVLQQYKDHGPGWGWHCQNSVVDWKGKRIVHYPFDGDFPKHGGRDNVNQSRSKVVKSFNPVDFDNLLLENALQTPNFEDYIKDLTGLRNPRILLEIGEYFENPAKVWASSSLTKSGKTCSAWLGCGDGDLDISTSGYLGSGNAARGVLDKTP